MAVGIDWAEWVDWIGCVAWVGFDRTLLIDLIEQIEMIGCFELMRLVPEGWHLRSKHWWLWLHWFQWWWEFVVSRNDWIGWIDQTQI